MNQKTAPETPERGEFDHFTNDEIIPPPPDEHEERRDESPRESKEEKS